MYILFAELEYRDYFPTNTSYIIPHYNNVNKIKSHQLFLASE